MEKNDAKWKLYQFKKYKFEHQQKVLQPGEPTFSQWEFTNEEDAQDLNFALTMMGKEGKVINPWIELDGYFLVELKGEYDAGTSIVCDGKSAKLYNKKGEYVKEVTLNQNIPMLKKGKHSVKFNCKMSDESG
ncbi:MAG TPA: hypothetical protein PKD85_23195, partial [Saprospiraceae bacterium]|nr:hypothetical protein [Saprospiraceae bacterium]